MWSPGRTGIGPVHQVLPVDRLGAPAGRREPVEELHVAVDAGPEQHPLEAGRLGARGAAVLEQSSRLVNALAEQARADAVRFAGEELAEAEAPPRGDAHRARRLPPRPQPRRPDRRRRRAERAPRGARDASSQRRWSRAACWPATPPTATSALVQADRRIAAITERIEAERGALGADRRRRRAARGGRPLRGARRRPRVRQPGLHPGARRARRSPAPRRGGSRATWRRTCARRSATTALYPRRSLLAGLAGLFLLLGWGVADARLLQPARQPLSLPAQAPAHRIAQDRRSRR